MKKKIGVLVLGAAGSRGRAVEGHSFTRGQCDPPFKHQGVAEVRNLNI